MKREKKLIKWHKNIGSAILIHLFLFILNTMLLFFHHEKRNSIFLILFLLLFLLIVSSYLYSLITWNSIVYLNNEKFWIKKKGKIIEWKFDEIIDCKISKCWYGRPRAYKIEIISNDNAEKLSFEYSGIREKKILHMVKNTNVEKLFMDAFK